MTQKTNLFSLEYTTLVVETDREITHALKASMGFSTTDYCILQQLCASDKPVPLPLFQDFLLLKQNSVTTAVMRLEARGFVRKTLNESDMRTFFIEATDEGKSAAEQASHSIRERLTERTWKNHPGDERINRGMEVHASRFFSGDNPVMPLDLDNEYFIVPAWVNGTRLIVQLWTKTLRDRFGLSLSEFRILALMAQREGELKPSDIAQELCLSRSAVSGFLKSLRTKNLVCMRVALDDKRNMCFEISEQGRELEGEAYALLYEMTGEHYSSIPEEDLVMLDGWHHDMLQTLLNS